MLNRIIDALPAEEARSAPEAPRLTGFIVCPLPLPGNQEQLRFLLIFYRGAYEQAREALEPSSFQRYLEPIWN